MNQFLEAATIALHAIWTNKLRSFLTVLGNIVAVTSIIAVVSLIQGMNAYVTNAIVSDVGADNFTIQRMPVVTDAGGRGARPQQPAASRCGTRPPSASSARTSARSRRRRHPPRESRTATRTLDGAQIQGVSRDYIYFSTFTAERGRLISPVEVESQPAGHGARLGRRRQAVRAGRPDRQGHHDRHGMHFRVVGVSEKKGSAFGNSQDEFAIIPLGSFQKMFGSRHAEPAAAGQAEVPGAGHGGDGRRDGGDADRAPAAAGRARQLRHVHLGHAARASTTPRPTASSPC